MKLSRLNWVTLAIAVSTFGMAAWYYPLVPDPVATHWNAVGQPDGWTAKPWGVWIFPLITTGMVALLLVLPVISPRGFRLDSARRAYHIVIFVLVVFMAAIEFYSFHSAVRGAADLSRVLPMLIGFLFIVLGNYLGKFPKNFFVGIRTPWTLASDTVWNRTHRMGGYLFMLAGAFIVAASLLGLPAQAVVVAAVGSALIPVVYSLVIYKRLHGFGGKESGDD